MINCRYYQTFLPPLYFLASPFLIKKSATSISPTLTEASNLKYLSLPKLYNSIFLPEYKSLSNSALASNAIFLIFSLSSFFSGVSIPLILTAILSPNTSGIFEIVITKVSPSLTFTT